MIGDSVSLGAEALVFANLSTVGIEATHSPGNAASSNLGVHCLDAWLAGRRWDVISFQFGLHDLGFDTERLSVTQYASLLANITSRLVDVQERDGTRLVWVTTTPVPTVPTYSAAGPCNDTSKCLNPPRFDADVHLYNTAAAKVLADAKHAWGASIKTLDLYSLVVRECGGRGYSRCPGFQLPANVHFTGAGYRALADATVDAVLDALAWSPPAPPPSASLRVAFVGNSYTFFNDLPFVFAALALRLPKPVRVTHAQVTPGGSSLADHADASRAFGRETRQVLTAGWDYVVLQDQTGGGKDGDSGQKPGVARAEAEAALRNFYAPALREANATPVLYSTWGRRDGDPINAACCGYGNFLSMTAKTSAGYQEYAAILRRAAPTAARPPLVVPVGRAFELIHNDSAAPLAPNSTFTCLYHHALNGAAHPAANCTLDSFGHGGHPSPLGTYLIACTFVATLLATSPVGIAWAPDGVSNAERDLMQRVAERAALSPVL